MRSALCIALSSALLVSTSPAGAQVTDYKVEGDGIPRSLTGKPGNAERGRALILRNDKASCLNCHTIKGMPSGGNKGPSLDGVGAALTPPQLRLSVVDLSRVTRGSPMPSFHAKAGVTGSEPKLSAEEIEDVVAYLVTLKK